MFHRLKVGLEEKRSGEKHDPMQVMMERIRSGNVQVKKVQSSPAPKGGSGDVMSEMAKLLVSIVELLQGHYIISINGC